jgi:DNA polymerase-3 subunit alpha
MSFVGLHIHSDYSLLDGASQLQPLIQRALELGMPAIALTDHGVMYGAIELIKTCRGKNIKPIIGNEMYIINGDITKREARYRKYHQVVLAKNTQGYKNLVKLTTISNLKGIQGKGIFARPCINKDLLKEYHEGLIVTSACLGGEIPQAILQGRPDVAREVAKEYKGIFGDDYYLEIQDHGYQEERIVNVEIVKISRELDIKIVATNDSHFVLCSDVEAHDALLCIQTGKLIVEEKRMRYSGTEYLKSAEEMAQLFRDHLPDDVIKDAIVNTLEVADKVKNYDIFNEPRIPNYPIPPEHTADTYVEEVAWKGLLERFNAKSRDEIKPAYKERMEYELKMIQKMGFSTYFLVVWDYIKYARDNGIPVGPGRGSAAGSLIAYTMRITNIDPVHHGLLFERFLNPERKSMPDIDTDFCIERRDDMIKYVTEKYGEDHVSQIITFNRMTSKAVLKDVARVLGIPYKKADDMAKMIPVSRGKPEKLKVMISDKTPAPEFKQAYDNNDVYENAETGDTVTARQWLDMAIRIEGTNKTFGVHAAGVVISSQPLDEIVPLQTNNDGSVISQYYMEDLEALGLLKMDFLGLKNLTIIQETAKLIEKNHHIPFNSDQLPLEERRAIAIRAKGDLKKLPRDIEKTYKLLENGNLEGVFQLESSGMIDIVKRLRPSCIEDISSILALYRPGPLDAGLIPLFINRKHGREEIKYDHPLLEPILQETYGTLCFQEQIMKMAQDLAGYSLGQADILRRCLSGSTQIVDAATGNLVSLKEIAQSPEYWLGRKVFSLNLNTQKITQQAITEIHPNGVRDIWQITTKTHRKIKATDDHLFYTLLGWQPLKSFKIGDRVGLAKTIPITNQSQISDAQIKLVAYLIGDGHLSTKSPSCSYFCNSDQELIDDFNACAKELFGKPAPIDHQVHPGRKSVTYARIGFVSSFNKWVDNHIKRAHSRDKEIPQWVLTLSRKQLQLFLGTLWSTDGSFDTSIGHTDYTSTSPVLIKQIQHLLLRLGIVALFNVKTIQYNGKPHISYRVQITGREDMLKFCELIQPHLSCYKAQQAQVCYLLIKDKVRNQSKHTIPPEIITLIAQAKKASRMTWDKIDQAVGMPRGTMSSGLNFQKTPSRSLSRHRVENFAIAFQNNQLKAIAESDIFWDEIIGIEYIGKEEVFDLSIPETHNFIANDFIAHNCMGKKKAEEMQKQRELFIDGATKNGVPQKLAEKLFEQMVQFAEYCFNKSHSMAYAYVTYQTAYLKANYPVEYMAALLTANSGDQDKVQKYIENCKQSNIMVEGPDINRSEVYFTPLQDKILFGFSAIKNVGEGAIAGILEARREGESFKSLAELCDRVNLQTLNRRTLESLILCGACDKLEPNGNRQQLMKDLDGVMKWAQERKKDRETGQGNLFDLFNTNEEKKSDKTNYESAPKHPPVPDFNLQDKLNSEKELLGFYVSEHPLKTIMRIKPVSDAITIDKFAEQKNKNVKLVAMISSIKPVTTKKGDRMAIIQLEDLTGRVEGVIFPKTHEQVQQLLEANAIVLINGKIDKRDDSFQIIIEDMKSMDSVKSVIMSDIMPEIVIVQLTPQEIENHEIMDNLKAILKEYSHQQEDSKVPVGAKIIGGNESPFIRFSENYWVQNSTTTFERLKNAGFHVELFSAN